MPRKIKIVHVAIADLPGPTRKAPPISHVVVTDADGRIWERFSDMGLGQWNQIERPEEPGPTTRARGRKR